MGEHCREQEMKEGLNGGKVKKMDSGRETVEMNSGRAREREIER